MFGMEDKKGKKIANFVFDLEMDLQDPGKLKAMKELVSTRVAEAKTLLRGGGTKEEFDAVQKVLQGYLAVQKVIQRMNRKLI